MVELTRPVSAAPPGADDGSASPEVMAALAARARGEQGVRQVAQALTTARLLVPLLEVSGDELEGSDTDPCSGQDRAVAAVSLRTPSGPVGLAFTSLSALTRWSPVARPWPTAAPQVATAVLVDGGTRLVVDAGSPQQIELSGEALRRLAAAEQWPDPWEDQVVRAAMVAALAPVLASGELGVRLAVPPGEAAGVVAGSANGLLVELAFLPAPRPTRLRCARASWPTGSAAMPSCGRSSTARCRSARQCVDGRRADRSGDPAHHQHRWVLLV